MLPSYVQGSLFIALCFKIKHTCKLYVGKVHSLLYEPEYYQHIVLHTGMCIIIRIGTVSRPWFLNPQCGYLTLTMYTSGLADQSLNLKF